MACNSPRPAREENYGRGGGGLADEKKVEERTESTTQPDDPLAALESGETVRILVVEDDAEDMESVPDQLKAGMRLPYEVRQAGVLREALEIIRAKRADLVPRGLGLPDTGPG